MYRNLRPYYWWNGMKVDIAKYVAKCPTCQQVKAQYSKLGGLLQPLEIPEWKQEHITMDFVVGLSRSQKGNDSIQVIIGRLTKSAYFIAVRKDYPLEKYAGLYVQQIIQLHRAPVTITLDRDPRFIAIFWKSLQAVLETKLQYSTAYHPQIDGQIERTIQTLEDMLRAHVLDFRKGQEEQLHPVKFTYNNSYQQSISMTPFKALYGQTYWTPICQNEIGERKIIGPELIRLTKDVVKVVKERLKAVKSHQKIYADKRQKHLELQVGDHVFLKVYR